LGASKNADAETLKKAYRKLAMKLHPDKCRAPGAEEAFKKISAAYGCLRDNSKRKMYDDYGTEAPQSRQQQFYGDQFQQMTPDDIIRMFFGGDFASFHGGGGTPFGFTSRTNRHHNHNNDNRSQGGLSVMLLQLLPLFLVLVLMVLPSLFLSASSNSTFSSSNHSNGYEGTHYSLTKNSSF